MKLLGSRLRNHRRQMHLHQKDIAGEGSSSFLSKVETGTAQPSLKSLQRWSLMLETTLGDLLGDHLLLEAAKQCVLLPEKCHTYLDDLPVSTLTIFLRELSTSASSLSTPVPIPPDDPELQYLTALVLLKRGMTNEASKIVESALSLCCSPLWRIYHLSLLCLIYDELSEPLQKIQAQDCLRTILNKLDHQKVLHTLPEADLLSSEDLELLKLSALFKLNPLD